MNETVIKVENVYKKYKLGAIGGGTLRGDLQSWWAQVRGKEDPNAMIGIDVNTKNKTFLALKGISFDVKKGETLAIIGGNGAGKSTTLKLLSRVTAPTQGTIKINGRISSLLEVGTGFHPELTGRENIYLNGAILGMSNEEVDSKIEDIIEFSECREFIDTPVKRYSSGMFVKLAFSVAAHLDSEILIMDEVLAVGDMKFQKKCIEKMLDIAKSGRTILYVSHNMNTIRRLCNRAIVLDKGSVKYKGDVETAINLYLNDKATKPQLLNDLSKMPRQDYLIDKNRAWLEYLNIIDRSDTTFKDNENFRCKIGWRNIDDMKDIQLRFEIRTFDDIPVATSVSSNTLSLKKGTFTEFDVELDISRLVSGKYQLIVVLSEMGASNNYVDIDAVYPACVFEVDHRELNDYKFKWNKKQWGYIQMKDLKIKVLQKNY